MQYIGYAHIIHHAGIPAMQPAMVAEVRSVTRKEIIGNTIAVPAKLALENSDLLGHVLFALKHEGVNLQVLAPVLPKISEPEIRSAFDASPNSQYLRKACFLWEYFTGQVVKRGTAAIKQAYIPLFNPKQYITGKGVKHPRWRVTFNGLGTLDYCVTVRRTNSLETLLGKNLLQKAVEFTDSLPKDILNRTLAWAYLHETKDSYAIENESPNDNKATRFVGLLKQAHSPRDLDEDYLVALQNAVISNVFSKAASFRIEQNYLSDGLRGALGVTYVPPTAEFSRALMDDLMALANHPPEDVDPLVLASIIAFGFVFIHPFMDGNGRLSRFLFHQVLCQRGALQNGLVLPVSIVMRQNETDYLSVLQDFSESARRFWDVTFIDVNQFVFEFKGDESIYRYWDGTRCVEFMAKATEQAIEHHLKQETVFLARYDELYRRIDQEFDVSNVDLSRLVMFCLDQNGKISKHRRKQYQYKVPDSVFDALEAAYQGCVK